MSFITDTISKHIPSSHEWEYARSWSSSPWNDHISFRYYKCKKCSYTLTVWVHDGLHFKTSDNANARADYYIGFKLSSKVKTGRGSIMSCNKVIMKRALK